MTELVLFLVVGGVAIVAAALMLLSENAVHSALWLIVNFACVALLYLMLDASFLAMTQIAVYAGAIMVLFLFVIMLLGAERMVSQARQFRWLTPAVLLLATAFLVLTSLAIIQGQIDLQGPSTRPPLLRVVHAATDAGPVDVYVNGELAAEGVRFGAATEFAAAPLGETTVALHPAGSPTPLLTSAFTLESDAAKTLNAYTVIAYGVGANATLTLLPDDLETPESRTARVTVFNAFSRPVDLVDFGAENPAVQDERVLIEGLAPGEAFTLPPVPENTDLRPYAFTEAGSLISVLFRLNNPELYRITREQSQLMVVMEERIADGTDVGATRASIALLDSRTAPRFGSPQGIGELLFTRYMLPLQMVAVLLLTAMIGVIVLTHKDDFTPRRRDVRRRVIKPLTRVLSAQIGHDVIQPEPTGGAPELPRETEQPEPVGD